MDPHPWYKRTEFWLTLGANGLGVLAEMGLLGHGQGAAYAGAALQVLSIYGYTRSRGDVKAAAIGPPKV